MLKSYHEISRNHQEWNRKQTLKTPYKVNLLAVKLAVADFLSQADDLDEHVHHLNVEKHLRQIDINPFRLKATHRVELRP